MITTSLHMENAVSAIVNPTWHIREKIDYCETMLTEKKPSILTKLAEVLQRTREKMVF